MIDLVFSLLMATLAFAGLIRIAETSDEFWRENCKQNYERNYEWQTIPSPG